MAQDPLFPTGPAEDRKVVTLAERVAMAAGYCDWPDGGCGAPILRIPSATTGKTMALNADPEQRVVIGEPMDDVAGYPLVVGVDPQSPVGELEARVLKVYVAHQATCPPYQSYLQRRQQARRHPREESR